MRRVATGEGRGILRHVGGRAALRPESDRALTRRDRDLLRRSVHRGIRELVEEGTLHVEAFPPRHLLVAHPLEGEVGRRAQRLGQRLDLTSQWAEVAVDILGIAEMRGADGNRGVPTSSWGRGPAARRVREVQTEVHVVRRRLGKLPIERGRVASAIDRERHDGGRHVRSDGVQPELERGRDPEVRPSASQTPEELRVVLVAYVAQNAIRGHKIDREQVVDREPVLPLEAAHAAAEREPGDARVSDDADRAREPVLLRGAVQLLEEGAAFDSRGPPRRIDFHCAHPGEIDDHAAVARREPGDAVAATAYRDDKVVLARELQGRDDVLDTSAARDERRMAVGDRIPDDARAVVVAIAGENQLTAETLPELVERSAIERLRDRHDSLPLAPRAWKLHSEDRRKRPGDDLAAGLA